jgi:hypothetical protein
LHDAGGPQQAAVDRVSILDDADDGSGRFCALFHRHRFVQRRIETLAQRLDRAHAETLERQRERAPGGFDAFDQRSLPAARPSPIAASARCRLSATAKSSRAKSATADCRVSPSASNNSRK